MLLFSPAESGESHGTAPCANLYCGPLLWALLRIVPSLVMLPSNTAMQISHKCQHIEFDDEETEY